jgi:protein SCO1/2
MMRALSLLILCTLALPAQPVLPAQLRDIGVDQKLNALLPFDIVVRDESGRKAAIGEYFGKRPVVLSLVYYKCPMLCDLVLNGMLRAFRTISLDAGKDFEVVTVSFDPHDTQAIASAKKANYLAKYGRPVGAAGWHFLTADQPEIQRLAAAVGFRYAYDEKAKQFIHASAIMVLTPDGHLSRYFYGVEYPPRDLRLALVESSRFRIGNPVDQILLFCFHYDPLTGRYGLLITRTIRIAGVLTVLTLIGGIVFLSRKPRKTEVESC